MQGDLSMVANAAYANGELDREIVLSRVIDAPRDQVFLAWGRTEAHVPMVWPTRVSLRGSPRLRSQGRRGMAIRHDRAQRSALRQQDGFSGGNAQ